MAGPMNSKHDFKTKTNIVCGFLLGLSLVATSGCMGGLGLNGANVPTETVPKNSTGRYRVEMSGNFSKSGIFEGDIDGEITVQDALERSGATKKFRNMDIMVYRVVKENGRGLKMPVTYKGRTKSVLPEQDYAIHPNDRIVIEARSNNAIDKIVDSLNPNN